MINNLTGQELLDLTAHEHEVEAARVVGRDHAATDYEVNLAELHLRWAILKTLRAQAARDQSAGR